MLFGNISLTINNGEIDIAVADKNIGYGEKNISSINKGKLLKVCRLIEKIVKEKPHFNGAPYLYAVCEWHTFKIMKKLGEKTHAHIDPDIKLISWRKNELQKDS